MGIPKQQPQQQYTVEQLLALNPYNPDILPDLENFVNEQVSSQTYSLDANLCLLRLYQFEPERMSTQIVARILVKALMAMPAPDFSLCLFLIPERVPGCLTFCWENKYGQVILDSMCVSFLLLYAPDDGISLVKEEITVLAQMEEQFKTLIVLSHYLETARFRQFWDEAAKNRHIVEVVPGFEQAIQAYAIHVLSLTYQKVPRTVLAEAINIEGLSLDKFLEHQVANCGWVLEKSQGKGQLIVLPPNEFNHPELKKKRCR
ncbi:Eukaryotic translation initiation factor 3 subunit K [Vitis vinifera]|uniref:Eukaryotic translation initiation factor 3 subunit K n=1 Tax=Vitis vinifera TaxID=29760 RepID=A0A438CZP4_VITVI|nr:Eukaryotic translation initiation factor 3 subunit K [Vitis vinifera]